MFPVMHLLPNVRRHVFVLEKSPDCWDALEVEILLRTIGDMVTGKPPPRDPINRAIIWHKNT